MTAYRTDCRFFTGYRPCHTGGRCDGCTEYRPASPDVLLINLDALGDVLRTTALLPAIMRRYPDARITWLTRARAAPMLRGNERVHRVLEWGPDAFAALRVLHFDLVLNADKSLPAASMTMTVNATERRGFGLTESGAIIPLNDAARHLYDLGLDDRAKFQLNQRTAPDLLAEALGFEHRGDGYALVVDGPSSAPRRRVGLNTGCGSAWPLKKLGFDVSAALVERVSASVGEPVVLLGGPEDAATHARLCEQLGDRVEATDLDKGVMHGAAELARCDVIVTGDSLGMHMAIALGKHVVAWFGPTCPAEIDLYGRGIKVLADVGCAPCYRSDCREVDPCSQRVSVQTLHEATMDCLQARDEGRVLNDVRGRMWWSPAL